MTWEPCSTVTVIVLVSAVVDAIVPVVLPWPSVSAGCTIRLSEPVADSTTVRFDIGVPLVCRITTVMVAVSIPFASTPVSGDAVADDLVGEARLLVTDILEPHPPSAASTQPAPRLSRWASFRYRRAINVRHAAPRKFGSMSANCCRISATASSSAARNRSSFESKCL